MRLKMLVGLSGNEYSLSPGDERDFPNTEAERLIAAGFAAAAISEPKGETDVVSRKGGDAAKRGAGKSAGGKAAGEG